MMGKKKLKILNKTLSYVLSDISKTSEKINNAHAVFDKQLDANLKRQEQVRDILKNGAGYYKQ
ncbi:hypothetical protein ABV523_17900 [Snodgrassella alvi]|uniref:hypothetical protein n=1 Tax=Snodgrassella TaxID=1193515 RepID=UPI00226AE810|nr:hypothetical protein [Snodgrassella sp. B3088]MCX8748209.1 hypothetical protein [Snodgrassella sp. B3088]